MNKFLLSVHVIAAILAIGPVAVAASMFPPAVRRAFAADGAPAEGSAEGATTLRTLHRICRVYGAVGIVVPVFGLATAGGMGVLGDTWLIVSIVLTAFAAAVLVVGVIPGQERAIEALVDEDAPLSARAPGPAARGAGAADAVPTADAVPAADAATTAPAPTRTPAEVFAARLAMHAGVFNLLWAAVTVLMIVRPGSTTGA